MALLELQAGDVVAGYTVRRALGRGGMGAVYLVHHPRFDVEMALKVMTLAATTEEELETARGRFTREAKTLIRLRHPNIIRVHDFAELVDEDGVNPYILMEFFPGLDGLKWVKTNPSLERVRHVAVQLADALSAAHDAGVIHRDIKYGNVLINAKDEGVLIDFGIAKSDSDETVTRTGLTVGTLSHMAPEYLDASMKRLDTQHHTVKTDLWAFGCLLYFFTAHRNAFQNGGKGTGALLAMILNEPHTPLHVLRPNVSEEWAQLVDDLLQKDPEKRIPNTGELKRRLSAVKTLVDPSKPAFVPPLPPGALRTPASTQSSAVVRSSVAAQSQLNTAQGRVPGPPAAVPGASASSHMESADDPFAGLKAFAAAETSTPALNLPPLDGVTGIHTSMAGPPSSVSVSAFKDLAPTPQVTPPMQAVVAVTPSAATSPVTPQTPVSEPPLPAALDGLGTFIASLQPETARKAPAASLAATTKPVPLEDATPTTNPVASASSFPAPELDRSIVEPLPSFAPPTPKATQKKSAIRSVMLPVAAVAVIIGLGFVSTSFLTKAPTAAELAKKSPPTSADDQAMKKAEERANREVAALEKAQVAVAVAVPVLPAPIVPTAAPTPTEAEEKPRSGSRAGGTAATTPAAAAVVDPIAAKYAGRTNFNTGAFGAQPDTATLAATGGASASPIAGVKIPVRVDNEIASTPSPVIAVVTKETKVGAMTLPVGTQIHGQSTAGQGVRVAITFRFAIVGGKNVPLTGQALAPDGRSGLPGVRTMGNGSDVAARSVGSAAQATADAAATLVGDNPLGAAVRGGGGTAASKSDRLNSDENVVIVKRGARFSVYVGG